MAVTHHPPDRSFADPELTMPVGETAIRERGVAAPVQTHGLATREAASAFGDRPARPGENVDIRIAEAH